MLHVITPLLVGGAQANTLLSVDGLDRAPAFATTVLDILALPFTDPTHREDLRTNPTEETNVVMAVMSESDR